MSHTPAPWVVATSNSFRRIVSTAKGYTPLCEPIVQNDGHPDLFFRNGGENGPDARLLIAAPDLLSALKLLDGRLRECFGHPITAQEAYDSFYQEEVRAAIAKASPKETT